MISKLRKTVTHKQQSIAGYYGRFGSWAGYNLVLGRAQHAGYWRKDTKNERQAQANYMAEVAKRLNLQSGERVLDAGSGQGYATRYLAERVDAKLIGITITPREVPVSDRLSKNTKNRPKFLLGDYSKTDFPNEYFDAIFTIETLVHAKDMQTVMDEFFRILKPGGRVVFFDYEFNTTNLTDREQAVAIFLVDNAGGFGMFQQNPGQISACLHQAGFTGVTEDDWSQYTKPTYDRLRRIARPLSWVKPSSRLAPFFVNTVMASHGYSNVFESGKFRYLVYSATKPQKA